ncbi:unnamed protein product [Protopolystoma xenopodis]|uniref:Bestrophin homolog n=1 Tax=Protopolystoma xenopodis TaxID=117903 RepID=A0A3S5BNK8_9PLAT|nr:unnamed protein product [Protopolystoma xenopodis]
MSLDPNAIPIIYRLHFLLIPGEGYIPDYWLPLKWCLDVLRKAEKMNYLVEENSFMELVRMINGFRSSLGSISNTNKFNIPLVYTQYCAGYQVSSQTGTLVTYIDELGRFIYYCYVGQNGRLSLAYSFKTSSQRGFSEEMGHCHQGYRRPGDEIVKGMWLVGLPFDYIL